MRVETLIAVAALFSGLALTGSVATLLYTQNILKRCFDILNYSLNALERNDKHEQEVEHAELTD